MKKQRVALFGLGLMGTGMARRLLGAGFPLSVYNRNSAKAAPLAAEGARRGVVAARSRRESEVIISMVADDVASRSMWLGDHGAARFRCGRKRVD